MIRERRPIKKAGLTCNSLKHCHRHRHLLASIICSARVLDGMNPAIGTLIPFDLALFRLKCVDPYQWSLT